MKKSTGVRGKNPSVESNSQWNQWLIAGPFSPRWMA